MTSSVDDKAESLLAASRSQRLIVMRVQQRIAELEDELAQATYHHQATFHRDEIVAATRRAMTLATETAGANADLIRTWERARDAIGPKAEILLERTVYRGLMMPDLVEKWRERTEKQLVAMMRRVWPRPASVARDLSVPVLPMLAEPQRRFMYEGWNSSNSDPKVGKPVDTHKSGKKEPAESLSKTRETVRKRTSTDR
jgi:hypothetical protein